MKDLTSGPIGKALISVSIPIILANLLQSAYQMIDTFWVGRLGAEAVAAVSLTFPVLFLSFSIGIGLSIAATVLVAQAAGKKDRERQDLIATQGFSVMMLVSLVLLVLGYAFSGVFMRLIGAEGEVLTLATQYLRISFLGVPFLFAFAIYQSIVRGIGEVKAPLYIVFATVLLNLVLDPLFIYGWGPIAGFGVAGAAVASVITQGVSALIGFALLRRVRSTVRIRSKYLKPRMDIQRSIFRIGFPSSVDSGVRALSFLIMAGVVATLGTTAIAAYGIGQRIFSFIVIPALGLSIGTSSVVGQNVGASKPDRVVSTIAVGLRLGFFTLSLVGVLTAIFARQLIAFFVPAEPAVIAMGVGFLRITGLTFGLVGVQMVVAGALRGAGSPRAALWITLINLFAVQVPLAWYLANYTALVETGVWIAIAAANVVGAALAYLWYLKKDWSRAVPEA